MKDKDTQSCIDACNKLLRGEISAVETYNQSLERFPESPDRTTLRQFMEDHRKSADSLRQHIAGMGGQPETSSGPWGEFAKAVTGAAKLLGKSPAVSVLRQGEEHGINEYHEALENPAVMDEAKTLIRTTLVPRLEKHIAVLDGLPA